MSALIPIITNAGINAIFNHDQNGFKAEISHVAIGDSYYTPNQSRTSLSNERLRVPIAAGQIIDDKTLHITALFDDSASFWVREIGFFLSDGTLLAVYSHPTQAIAYKNGNTNFKLAFDLLLTSLPPDSVTINEAIQDHSLSFVSEYVRMGTSQMRAALRSLRLYDRVTAIENKDYQYKI